MSRSITRDAAVLIVGGLIGAGAIYTVQEGPSAVASKALALYSGLLGGDGEAHAESSGKVAAADQKKGESEPKGGHAKDDGHGHKKDGEHSKDDGDGHGSGKDDGHGHDKPAPTPTPKADAGASVKVAANDQKGEGEPKGGHAKDDGHGHAKDGEHSKDDGDAHSDGKDDGHGHDKPKADAGAPMKVAADDQKKVQGEPKGGHAKDDGHGHAKDGEHSKDDGDAHGDGKDDGHGHDKPKPKADAGQPVKVAAVDAKAQDDGHGHGPEGGAEELPKGVVELEDAKVKIAGIAIGQAKPATLRDELQLNGVVTPNQEAVVQVTPRFPGIVRTLAKRLGDQVKKGDLLAVVESNQSLTTYELRAPIAGVVTERQASLGEYVSEQKPAFVVTDLSTLWVDLSVYRRDLAKVAVGESVRIDPEDGGDPVEAKISYLSPIGAADTQSAIARVVIENDGRFRPGLFATGSVATAEVKVALAVSVDAIQSIDGRDVVFVRDGDRFATRDVMLGRRDSAWVEILSGLKAGEPYASKNSFVVKAELAKGTATHGH